MNIPMLKKCISLKYISLWALLILLTPNVFAASHTYEKKAIKDSVVHTTPVILTLEDIEVIKTAEQSSSDEIYINITEYSSVDKPTMHRIPEYPSHWLSKYTDKIKNVSLWQKSIQDKESVELVISVIESDAPPWDVDDLIGTVKLKVYLEKGKLEQEWTLPNNVIAKQEKEKGHFLLTGDGAEYKISLKVKIDKNINKDKNKK